jgi:hypothetical protein
MIQLRQEWSNWYASVHPTRSDLPILAQSPLRTLSSSKEEALAAAKLSIDEAFGDDAAATRGVDQQAQFLPSHYLLRSA